jgi:hypothetical protein
MPNEYSLELVGGPLDGKVIHNKKYLGEELHIRAFPRKIKDGYKYVWGVKNKKNIPKVLSIDNISILGKYKRETRIKIDKNCRVVKRFYKFCGV